MAVDQPPAKASVINARAVAGIHGQRIHWIDNDDLVEHQPQARAPALTFIPGFGRFARQSGPPPPDLVRPVRPDLFILPQLDRQDHPFVVAIKLFQEGDARQHLSLIHI